MSCCHFDVGLLSLCCRFAVTFFGVVTREVSCFVFRMVEEVVPTLRPTLTSQVLKDWGTHQDTVFLALIHAFMIANKWRKCKNAGETESPYLLSFHTSGILCVLRSEKVFGFPFHSYRDAVLNRFGTRRLPGSRVAGPFGFTPKKVLGIESCGNLRLRQLQNRLQTLWSSYQTIDFESLKIELTGRPPDVALKWLASNVVPIENLSTAFKHRHSQA